MTTPSGILGAGTLVARGLAGASVYLDSGDAPVLNLQHQFPSGIVNISAGANPSAGFFVQPTAANSQIFSGPNASFSNTLSVPGTFTVGLANVGTGLNVSGPSTLTGNVFLMGNTSISGSANVVSNLSVGNTIFVPNFYGNSITASGVSANLYLETRSAQASNTAALYLSNQWRFKVVMSGTNQLLAMQNLVNGVWQNSQIFAPPNLSLSVNTLLNAIL